MLRRCSALSRTSSLSLILPALACLLLAGCAFRTTIYRPDGKTPLAVLSPWHAAEVDNRGQVVRVSTDQKAVDGGVALGMHALDKAPQVAAEIVERLNK